MKISDEGLLRSQANVNGQWSGADGGETSDVLDPATGNVVATVAKCGAAVTRRVDQTLFI
jgi:succinate-semialdehyde dehydrogenase / glutarate-semialdehyde dehydrogenase